MSVRLVIVPYADYPLKVVPTTNILLYHGKTVDYLLNGHFHDRPMEYQLAGVQP